MKKKLKGICYPREKVRKLCLMTKLSLILTFFLFADTGKRIFPADSFKYKDGQCQHEAAVCGD